jgi:hypothetical protein
MRNKSGFTENWMKHLQRFWFAPASEDVEREEDAAQLIASKLHEEYETLVNSLPEDSRKSACVRFIAGMPAQETGSA